MKANALARHYGNLTAEERFRLILAAGARGDKAEEDRLVQRWPAHYPFHAGPCPLRPCLRRVGPADLHRATGRGRTIRRGFRSCRRRSTTSSARMKKRTETKAKRKKERLHRRRVRGEGRCRFGGPRRWRAASLAAVSRPGSGRRLRAADESRGLEAVLRAHGRSAVRFMGRSAGLRPPPARLKIGRESRLRS